MKKLSVVIPSYNRRHVLARTIPALSAQDLPPEDYEVIVVLDGSNDGSMELLRDWKPKCDLRVLESEHRGPSAARNIGISAAVGEIVLFLDDDYIAVPALFRRHCESHSTSELSLVQGRVCVAPGSAKTMFRYISEICYEDYYYGLNPEVELRYPDKGPSFTGTLASLANSSVSRDVLLRSGAFDEKIWAAEDLELGMRLWKMGVPFRYQPAAIVYEYYVKSSGEYLQKQAPASGEGDYVAGRKHTEYRPYSRLAIFAETPIARRWLRSALMRLPVSPVPLLAVPLRFEKWFYRFSFMRELGARLLRATETVARQRGALKAAGSWNVLRSAFDRKLPGLLYHRVGPQQPNSPLSLTVIPEQFERQIRWLARQGYTGVRPSDWLRWCKDGTGLPEKPVVITFDDAYADIAEFALPVLRKHGFGAVVYVVTGQIGGFNNWDQGCSDLRLMTAEQIQYWASQGIEFGAHSRTHPELTQLSASELSSEIVGSKNDLTALIGAPVISFAYPYGVNDDRVRNLVRLEFDLAFGVEQGMNYLRDDLYLLKRTCVGPTDSLFEFAHYVRRGEIKSLRKWRIQLALRSRLKAILRSFSKLVLGK